MAPGMLPRVLSLLRHKLGLHQAHYKVPKAAALGYVKPTSRGSRKPPNKEQNLGETSIAGDTGRGSGEP